MPFKNAIAITIDNNYVQHACVMLKSIAVNINSSVEVYCVYTDLSHQNIQLMSTTFKGSWVRLQFVAFDSSVLPTLPIKATDHVTSATFFRIWLPHLFKKAKQILFMDTDVIVNGDISELLNTSVNHHPLAAVPEIGITDNKKQTLGMAANATYFNCGILLLNLEYFRQNQLTERIAQFIITHPELCELWDQDAINATLNGNFYTLDYKYNVQSGFYEDRKNDASVLKAIENPLIIHYTGGGYCKPWFYNNTHPLRHLYYKYLKLTSFRNYFPPDLPRSWRIFRKLKFRLFINKPQSKKFRSE
jgi:lipopolysaccharide biosynthesis glycosyltransferase